MSTAQDISKIVKNPPYCRECKSQRLVVTSQSMAINKDNIGSVVNAGCGSCGEMYQLNLKGEILEDQ